MTFDRLKPLLFAFIAALPLTACQESFSQNSGARILAVGDSLMAWNAVWGSSISDTIEQELGEAVVDRSVAGAWMQIRPDAEDQKGFNIPYQYVKGDWDWVVVNGGGNDLLFGCGCGRCDRIMNRMISADGSTGQIPDFLRRIRDDGARVLYTGYLRSPGLLTPIDHCKSEGDELEARIARLAQQEKGIEYVSMQDVVPNGGLFYFAPDLIHPSPRSSHLIGKRLAAMIRRIEAQ
ncbi:MAG: SGNH/GDSL hydrolase family protein [Ruegeria sp.]|uniref:SGNH/GDSL hydrolase family protein n=1 Tax=Ruegeria sp. TaxID=1879320 RepID=UPI00349EA932